MKKILFAVLLLSQPVSATEWALLDSSNTVVQVIVSDYATIMARPDGPWYRTYEKVGKGYKLNGDNIHFTAPVTTTTVIVIP